MERFIFLFIFLIFLPFGAEAIEWNEPEVVPERLARQGRRVLRFSGTTDPGVRVRVRDNKIKMYPRSGGSRTARIPRRNANQFPVVADDEGNFVFDLYLPTTKVIVPVEVFRNGGWVNYNINMSVPNAGAAYDFQAIEETLSQTRYEGKNMVAEPDEEVEETVEKIYGEDNKNARSDFVSGNLYVWGGLGLTYFMQDTATPNDGNLSASFSGLDLPLIDLGAGAPITDDIHVDLALLLTTLTYEANSSLSLLASDGSWMQATLGASYRPGWKWGSRLLGLDAGLMYNQVPYVKLRDTGGANHVVQGGAFTSLYAGVSVHDTWDEWLWTAFARLSYAVTSPEKFAIESGFGLHVEGGAYYRLSESMSFGGFAGFNYFTASTTYSIPADSIAYDTDYSLMTFNLSARLKIEF